MDIECIPGGTVTTRMFVLIVDVLLPKEKGAGGSIGFVWRVGKAKT